MKTYNISFVDGRAVSVVATGEQYIPVVYTLDMREGDFKMENGTLYVGRRNK